MAKFVNFNIYAEIPEDIDFTPADAEAIMNKFEDILRAKDFDIEDSEYEILDY